MVIKNLEILFNEIHKEILVSQTVNLQVKTLEIVGLLTFLKIKLKS